MCDYAELASNAPSVSFAADFAPELVGSTWGVVAGLATKTAVSAMAKNTSEYLMNRGDYYMHDAILLINTQLRVFSEKDLLLLRKSYKKGMVIRKEVTGKKNELNFFRLYYKKRVYKNIMKEFNISTKKKSSKRLAKTAFQSVDGLPDPDSDVESDSDDDSDEGQNTSSAPPSNEGTATGTESVPVDVVTDRTLEECVRGLSTMFPDAIPLRAETNSSPTEQDITSISETIEELCLEREAWASPLNGGSTSADITTAVVEASVTFREPEAQTAGEGTAPSTELPPDGPKA